MEIPAPSRAGHSFLINFVLTELRKVFKSLLIRQLHALTIYRPFRLQHQPEGHLKDAEELPEAIRAFPMIASQHCLIS